MSGSTQFSGKICFGEFELNLETAELRRDGVTSILPGQPLQVLVTLLNRPGELVTREELKKQLWPADTFVDFNQSLNKAVNRVKRYTIPPSSHVSSKLCPGRGIASSVSSKTGTSLQVRSVTRP